MTKEDWACAETAYLLFQDLLPCWSERKTRLFGVACLRSVWPSLNHAATRLAIEIGESYAEGKTSREELYQVWSDAEWDTAEGLWVGRDYRSWYACPCCDGEEATRATVEEAVRDAEDNPAWWAAHAAFYARELAVWKADPDSRLRIASDEKWKQYRLHHDIFGKSQNRKQIPQNWRSFNVSAIARSIYDKCAFERLPILADALEDAGCTDVEILNHCRQDGVHMRGCWVVDLILDKK